MVWGSNGDLQKEIRMLCGKEGKCRRSMERRAHDPLLTGFPKYPQESKPFHPLAGKGEERTPCSFNFSRQTLRGSKR